ncbi:50S ribosomal protein L33 [Cantharellus anzutake]|uniref:50S ribosomal protein L33 n=1 Tax=Cantharellus anzutake TaxID=1750568 RepID=UPI0019082F22|nr:50S ribosomal protein L33 [Cantharellus anzutake]XP_038913268.1 50S ribosomal protein L33 [Cantharellus anzutake]KAF8321479.1 50S ribosomal protein L33 [Cantharellus anzutake]KAF8327004.1 50S ribosomal protein L33 [Cantharellus anzutake]
MAAKAKARMVLIRLVSTARTGYTYTTQKNRKYPTFSIKKYDPMIKRHVLFVEQKMK